MPWTRRPARISKRPASFARKRGAKRRRRLFLEQLEPRRLLAQIELTAVVDGEVADRDLDGTFETVTNGTTIKDRWFDVPDIGQERGVFEFDLRDFPAGAALTAAKIGLDIGSYTSPPDPTLVFRSYAGDGAITVADGDAASLAAGTGTVSQLGYVEFTLDPGAIESHVGGYLGIRLQNTALNAKWASLASIEGFGTAPKLILDYDPVMLTVAVQADSISEADGTSATTALVTRNGDLSQPLSVTMTSNDTGEATVSSPITIPALVATVEVPIDAVDDPRIDGTQTVTITASATGYVSGTDTVDVTDDDTAGVTVAPLSGLVTTEAGGTAQFTLVLDSQPTANVTVDVASTDTGEGTVSPSTVTFTPSDWDVPKTVTVTGVDDLIADGDQSYTIVTGLASSNDVHYGSSSDPIVVEDVERGQFITGGSNQNGTDYMVIGESVTNGIPEYRSFITFDLSGITIPVMGAELSLQVDSYNSTSSFDFSVYDFVLGNDASLGAPMTSLDVFNDLGSGQVYGSASLNSSANPVGSTFTVQLSAAAVADINSKSGGLFTVGFADDDITGGNNANLRLDRDPSLRVNQLLLWTNRPGIDPADVAVTNQDNETPKLTVSVLADAVPENAGIEATAVTITRNTDTTADLVVNLASSDTSEVTVPATATIPAGHNRVTVALDAVDDTEADGPQTVTITATATGFTAGADSLMVTDVEADPLGDWVWYDTNGNGVQDAGEAGVAGAVVELFESTDAIVGNADDVSRGIDVTDSQGHYQLAGLIDGHSYYLEFRAPTGYSFTTLDAGSDDGVDSDANSLGLTPLFVHTAGQGQQGWDAGLVAGPPEFGFAGRAGGPFDDNATAVETDAAGNVYVTGTYREMVDFDFGPGVYNLHSCLTDDVYVAKYTPQGALIWARGVDGSGTDASYGMVVTDAGDVVVTGSFQGTADFDPGTGTYALTSAGANDIFVWKLDAHGNLVWARAMGGTANDLGRSVAVTPDGGVVITGEFLGTADFDPGPDVHSLTNSSTLFTDVFVTRLDAAGDFMWAKRLGGSRYDRGYAVAVGPDGSVFTVGSFENTVDFDPGPGTYSLSSTGSWDAFLWKLDDTGNFVWAKKWGGIDTDAAYDLVTGADGGVYIAGTFRRTVDFDPGPGTFEMTATGFQDGYVSKLDLNGEFIWAKSWGGTRVGDMKLAADESLYLGGYFSGTVDFDPGDDTLLRTSAGSNDAYVSVLDHNGNLKWAQSFGGVGDDQAHGVAVARDGGAYLGGQFPGTADFDPRAGVFELTSQAGNDLFLARVVPPLAPTAVQLLEDRVLEEQPAGTPVGALAGVDPDAGETFTFRLASGTGDADNNSFRLDDGFLWTAEVFDYETKNSFSIRVRATDGSGLWFEQPLTVDVLPIAQAASIGNRVWHDVNANGLQDVGESGVAGAVVNAYSTDDGILRGSTITDANGLYTLGGLLPGLTYHAVVHPPAGYSFTVADAGSDDAIDSDADAVGKTPSVSVVAGESVDTLDAGLIGSQPYFGFASTIATTGDDRARAIATDAEGNIYLAGMFRNTADFDPGPGVFEMTGVGLGDVFVAKYTATGAFLWAKAMGGTGTDEATGIVVAADGNIVVAGSFQGTADFDPGSGEHLLTSKGSADVFVSKLDPSGRLLWVRQAGYTSSDYAYGLAGAPDGSVYVAGYFSNTVDFDPGPETFNLTASGNDAFVWKLDAQGDFGWAARLGGPSNDFGYGVAVTPTGNVVTTGTFQGTADMDPGTGISNLTSAGSTDVFLSVLDATGAFVWARRLGGTGADLSNAVAVASDGSVFTAGRFSNTVDFDPGTGTFELTSAGSYDAFVSKLDSSGNFAWAAAWGGPNWDEAQGIAPTADGGAIVTGSFADTADFDPGPGVIRRTSAGSYDVVASRLNATGGLEWVQTFGGAGLDVGYGVVAGADGSVYTTGKVVGTADFDPRNGEYAIAGGGLQDVFLSRLLPPQAPTGLSLAQDRVLEQQPVNTTVGNFVAVDAEPGETFVFELVSGTGDDDNAAFALDGNPLHTQAVFDHSVKQTYSIRVRATDSAGLSFEQPLTVSVVEAAQAGSIGDLVWDDQNGNGIQDAGEPGVGGVAVEAFSSGDGLSRGSSVTDANGNYTIGSLLPDLDYVLQFRPPVGFEFTSSDVGGDDGLDSDADATGRTSPVSVSAGATLDDVDAGLVGAAPWFGFALGAGAPSTASNVEDRGRAVAIDAAGNIYVTGSFQETVDFDPGPGVYELTSQGSLDAVVAKYAPGGALIWAASFGGLSGVIGTALTLAPNGDILVAGEFSGTADFRPGGGRELLTSAGGYDAFVARLDSQGHLVWARSLGGTSNDRATGVATSPDGSVVVTGYFAGTADFDPGPGTSVLTSAGADDVFVLKLDGAGDLQWARRIGGTSFDQSYGVTVASDGSVYTSGSFRFTVDFDPGPGQQSLTSFGNSYDAFVSKLDASGNYVWAGQFGGTGSDYATSVTVAPDGSVYTAGYFSDVADFDPGAGTYPLTSAGSIDAFVVKTNTTGGFVWARALGGAGIDRADAIAIGPGGGVYFTGYVTGVVDLDPGPGTFMLPETEIGSEYVINLDAAGDFQWARRVPAARDTTLPGLAVAADGSAVLTASYGSTADFAPGSDTFLLTAQNYLDLYLYKLHPPLDPTAISVSEDRVMEQQPPSTVVGSLSAHDPDPGDVFSYALVAGSGGDDNIAFQIDGDALLTAAQFDFATKPTYTIRVRATDSAGRWYEQPLTIQVQSSSTAASIGDRVWSDVNGNGIQDAGEPGVAGAVVQVFSADDDLPRGVAVTDTSGNFTLGGLLPAKSYYLQFRPPTGYDFTAADVGGNDAVDSDASADGKTSAFSVSAGENQDGWDAGLTGMPPGFGFAFRAGDVNSDSAAAIDLDEAGNVYVTGTFRGTVDFDPGPGVFEFTGTGTSQEGFIAKYTAAGALVWAAHLDGTSSVYGVDIHAHNDGFVYVTGSYTGNLNYRVGSAVTRLDGAGATDIFVAKLDSTGNPVWLKGFVGGSGTGQKVRVGADGGVYTVGSIRNTIDFDPGPGTFNLSYVLSYDDTFISKLDANGDFVWAKLIAGSGFVGATGFELATDGSLYLGGGFRGTIDFDPGTGVFNLFSTISNKDDAYIAKLDSNGDFVWVRRVSGTGTESTRDLAVAADGSVIATGSFENSADFDPGSGAFTMTAATGYDGFLWKLDAAGDFVWAKQFAGTAYEYGQNVELASDGSIVLTGIFSSSVDVDPGPDTFMLDSVGGYDTFVAKFDSAANLQWVQSFDVDDVFDIALAPDGSVYTAGAMDETNSEFDPRSGVYRLTSAGGSDIFVALHRPPSAPTGVILPANRVFEDQPSGTVVGGLVGVDPDAGELFNFVLVSGTGDDDNASFTIEGGALVTAAVFDAAAKDTYSIRVEAIDLAGLRVQAPLTVRVVPVSDAATITGQLWIDIDADGLREVNEPPVVSAVAELRTAEDQIPRDTVVIDVDGQYTFSGVVPSVDYVVTFRVPVGYDYTDANVGVDDAIDSDADALGVTHTFSPTPGQALGGLDAGVVGTLPSFGFALGIGSESDEEGRAITTDAEGNVYVTGWLRGTSDFDPGPGETILTNRGAGDAFLAKYTRLGVLVWAKQIGGGGYLFPRGLVVAEDGNLAWAGSYSGEVDFDPGPGQLLIESTASATFVVSLNTDGELMWARSLAADVPTDMVADSDGGLLVTGRFSGTDDFDPGPGTLNLTSAGGIDSYVVKLDATGALVWARAYGGTGNEYAERIAVDASGRIYLTGYFESVADFDPGPCSTSLNSAGSTDIFILQLDTTGDLVWAAGIGGTAADYGRALAVSSDGAVYGSGLFNGTVDFDPGPNTFPLQTHGFYDIPIFRLDPAGNYEWAGQMGGTDWDQAYDLALDPDGNLVGVGGFKDVADFDPGVTDIPLTSAGGSDIVVFRLNSLGAGLSAVRFGGPGEDLAYGLHVSSDGSVFATGYFSDTADFDPGTTEFALTSSGGRDAFLVKLTSNRPPQALALSNSSVLETSPPGTLVGNFSTSDPNAGDSFTYTLVPGAGDADNGAFQIADAKLETSAAIGGQSSFNIRVRTTDRDGQWFEATFVITVTSNVDLPPEVDSVVRADTNPTNASTVHYTVTFTEPVTGVDTDDFLLVANGVTGAVVTDVAGSGTTYTVTVDAAGGEGTLRLDVSDDDSILDSASQPLGGVGAGNGTFNLGETYTFDLTPPQVISVERVGVTPTNASTVEFKVTFSESVSGVDAADFDLVTGGLAGVSITNITNQGTIYTVTVHAGTGDGTLRLDVVDNDSITDTLGNPLGGPGAGNGDYNSGQLYTFDRSPPTVQSILRAGSNPTDAAAVTFTVTFSESVTGVDVADFSLTTTGLPGAAVTGVSGSGDTWSVTASTGLGDGTIRLDVIDDDSILDAVNNLLGGTGAGNGNYTDGDSYTIDRTGEIHGRNWDDRDGDGYWDPAEPGLAGITMFLDLNNNGVWDVGEPTAITMSDDPDTTGVDETGEYRFEDLGPSTYYVTEVVPTGWHQTYPVTRTGGTGELTSPHILWDNQDGIDGLDEAAGIAVSPDGNHIYVAAYRDHSLTVFERDPKTGHATLLQVARNNTNGITGLFQAQSVVVSPDGRHVYVSSDGDDSVVAFSRDPLTGLVSFIERERDGVGGVDGLNAALSVTISSDGAHVYATGRDDNAVAVFERDSITGELTFVQVLKDGVGGVDGLAAAFSVAISPDGAHAYVTGSGDDAVAIFSRNLATGLLTYLGRVKDGEGVVNGLDGATGVVVSPDGNHVYVAGHQDDRIAVFSRNATTGALTYVQSIYNGTTLNGVIGLSLSPDGKHLYTASEIADTVSVYSRNTSSGSLTFVESFQNGVNGVEGLDWVWFTTVSPDGQHVYAVGALDDTLVVFDRNAGTVQPQKQTIGLSAGEVKGPYLFANANDAPVVTAITRLDPTPTGAASARFFVTFSEAVTGVDSSDFAFAPGSPSGAAISNISGSATDYTITVDTGSGDGTLRLDLADNDSIIDIGARPLGGVGIGDGDFAQGESYVVDRTPPSVVSIVRGSANPTDQSEVVFTVTFSESVTGVNASDFLLLATGSISGEAILNVSGSGNSYAVSASAGSGDGTLRLDLIDDDSVVDQMGLPLGGSGANNGDRTGDEVFTILPDSAEIRGVKWSDLDNDGQRDAGEPGVPGVTIYLDLDGNGQFDAGEPSTVTLADDPATASIDEAGTYALTGLESGTYDVMEIEPVGHTQTYPLPFAYGTGELTFSQLSNVSGLRGAFAVTVSPDGKNVYAVSTAGTSSTSTDGAIVAFSRNQATGQITQVNTILEMSADKGLGGAQHVIVSPDQKHVYVAGTFDDAIAVLSRDETTGALTHVEASRAGGLNYVQSLAISPDGAYLYAVGSHYVSVLARNATSGTLTHVQKLQDGVGGIDGLWQADSIVMSPDGKHVYTVSYFDDALVAFDRNATTGELSVIEIEWNNQNGVSGLDFAYSVTISSDGKHVYTASRTGGLALFTRDEATGEVSFTDLIQEGVDVTNVLEGAHDVKVAADGAHVYVASYIDNTLSTFSRDPGTGLLSFVQVLTDGVAGVDGLAGVRGVAISPDGAHVYTASYEDVVDVFERDGRVRRQHRVDVAIAQVVENIDFGNHDLPPVVMSLVRADTDPTNQTAVDYTLTFNEPVSGVDPTDFVITASGLTGASVTGVSGGDTIFTVTVNTGTGDGTLRLDLLDNDSIVDSVGNELGGAGTGNGNFTGETYSVDNVAPTVVSIVRLDPNPTSASEVSYEVTFSEEVSGVDVGDFILFANGLTGAHVDRMLGSGATYTVFVNPGSGEGTLRLDVDDDDSIVDDFGNPLGGIGVSNGDFSSGEAYAADSVAPAATLTAPSFTNDTTPSVTVVATDGGSGVPDGTAVALDVDLNNDGDFADAGEAGYSTATLTGGNVTFDISPALSPGTFGLRARVSDQAGNEGISARATTVVDTAAPTVSSLSPPDDATGVAVGADLVLTFNENVRKGIGNILIKKLSDGSIVQTIEVTNGAVTISGAVATIDPPTDLSNGVGYYITLAPGVFEDLAGNDFAGISDNSEWDFTTLVPTAIVTARTDTPSAITFTFSHMMDGSSLNLYDIESGAFGAADMTVVGSSVGTVTGSLVFGGDRATFVPTGGLLAPDEYTVTLRSGVNAFKSASGELLDGNADGTTGDDYVATFTINPPAALVVGLPDFVRGPNQPVDVPATAAGLPIRLSNGAGVESVDITIEYDPSLLAITGGSVGPGAPAGATAVVNVDAPGVAVVTFFSPTALSAGAANIVSLAAAVPSDAAYKASHLLHISSLSVNEGNLAATADDAIHVAAYFGDATGNGAYSGLDAQRVARVSVGLDSGYAAFPLIDPVVIGDITGNGALSGLDANRIAQEAVGIDRLEIPPIPSSGSQSSTGSASDLDATGAIQESDGMERPASGPSPSAKIPFRLGESNDLKPTRGIHQTVGIDQLKNRSIPSSTIQVRVGASCGLDETHISQQAVDTDRPMIGPSASPVIQALAVDAIFGQLSTPSVEVGSARVAGVAEASSLDERGDPQGPFWQSQTIVGSMSLDSTPSSGSARVDHVELTDAIFASLDDLGRPDDPFGTGKP